MHTTSRSCRGFTLVELIVSLAVGAILLTMAVPSFQGTLQNNRMAANVNEFISALNLARSEAIKQGRLVTVCEGAAAGCTNTARWEGGWVVFADDAANTGTLDAGTGACLATEDCLLRVYPALTTGYTFVDPINTANSVTYNAKGFAASATTLIMCDARGFVQDARGVVISATGRAQTMPANATDATGCS